MHLEKRKYDIMKPYFSSILRMAHSEYITSDAMKTSQQLIGRYLYSITSSLILNYRLVTLPNVKACSQVCSL
jgi:hypothetical protein